MNLLEKISKRHKEWIEIVELFGVKSNAEDLVQEMYLQIHKANIDEEKNYNGYVYICLRNLAYTYHKNKKYNLEIQEDLTECNNYADNRLNWLDLQKVMHELPLFERQIIELHKIDKIPLLEIQRKTGICRVKMTKARDKGIDKLKKKLYG